jgi:hypothetical protein
VRRHLAVEAVQEACQGRRDSVGIRVFFGVGQAITVQVIHSTGQSTMKKKGTREDEPERKRKETTRDQRLQVVTLRDHSKPQMSWTTIGREVSTSTILFPV